MGVPTHDIEDSGRRSVPHGGFAAVRDDIAKEESSIPNHLRVQIEKLERVRSEQIRDVILRRAVALRGTLRQA